ncbi:C-C motif chemokine 3-like [Pteronotus mesoamericanus]|uniref:C-C motif chemokine 3-like n=1 Tax=Pteronotus mesoamericanus TaxID=1884717 RepID=UPI0023ED48E3|nr:C-C motif chemokine 3-like [Pteronotus parnellii mesoamericanus]
MKVLGAAVLVLLCTRALCAYQKERTYVIAPTCCMSYTPRQMPRKLVVSYFKTSGQCSNLGVVFLTKKGRHICANPSDAWVQDYITNMKETPQGDM